MLGPVLRARPQLSVGSPTSKKRARRTVAVATIAGLLGTGLAGGASSAVAAVAPVVNEPPANGHSLIVFPERDFVHGDGWPITAVLTAQVFRNGTVIATSDPISSAAGTLTDDPKTPAYDGMFDLNHLGAPCWAGTTPDILPGDRIVVTDQNGVADATTTSNVTVTQKATDVGGTITVKGTAADAAGAPLPLGAVQARLIAKGLGLFDTGKRDIRATPVYDAPGSTNWTATWTGLSARDVGLAVGSETRVLWLGLQPGVATALGSPIDTTIFEFAAFGGPSAGCLAPQASFAVTSSTPAALNITSNSSALTLSGLSQNATAVAVTLTDSAGTSVTPPLAATISPAGATGAQTWSALIPAALHNTLVDGTMTASAVYSIAGGSISGTSKAILKDTIAPAKPVATPPGGTYGSSQAVTLSSPDGSPIFDTVDGSAPTAASPRYTGQIVVSASQRINAITQDAAGNLSPAASNMYIIANPPGAPTVGTAVRGNASAMVRWTAPANGGSAITGYSVRVVNSANAQVGALRPAVAGATSLTVNGLVNGTAVRFQVQAKNVVATGALSAMSNTVTPATVATAPHIGLASSGAVGGAITASARWTPPASDGGSAISGYSVTAQRISATGAVVAQIVSGPLPSRFRILTMTLPRGNYRFVVRARNALGLGNSSLRSGTVTAR